MVGSTIWMTMSPKALVSSPDAGKILQMSAKSI